MLSGGLTNTNVRVTTSDLDVVVRISSKDSSMLAIDREAEFYNSRGRRRVRCGPAQSSSTGRRITCSWSSTSTPRPSSPEDLREQRQPAPGC